MPSGLITVLYKGSRHQLHRVTSVIRWEWGRMAAALGFLICWLAELAFRGRKGLSPGGVRRLARAPGRGSRGPGLENLAQTLGATWGRGQTSQAEQAAKQLHPPAPSTDGAAALTWHSRGAAPRSHPSLPRPLGAATQELARQGLDTPPHTHTHTSAGLKTLSQRS